VKGDGRGGAEVEEGEQLGKGRKREEEPRAQKLTLRGGKKMGVDRIERGEAP